MGWSIEHRECQLYQLFTGWQTWAAQSELTCTSSAVWRFKCVPSWCRLTEWKPFHQQKKVKMIKQKRHESIIHGLPNEAVWYSWLDIPHIQFFSHLAQLNIVSFDLTHKTTSKKLNGVHNHCSGQPTWTWTKIITMRRCVCLVFWKNSVQKFKAALWTYLKKLTVLDVDKERFHECCHWRETPYLLHVLPSCERGGAAKETTAIMLCFQNHLSSRWGEVAVENPLSAVVVME